MDKLIFKNSEIADKLEISHPKVKRMDREILGPNPKATMRSGYAREHTLREAFIIYLACHLVSALHFTVFDARQILSDIDAWLEKQGMYPDLEKADRAGLKVESWKINILKEISRGGFFYDAEGTISLESKRRKNRNVYTRDYITEWVITSKTPDGISTLDMINVKILRISYLLEIFKLRMAGKNLKDHAKEWAIHM